MTARQPQASEAPICDKCGAPIETGFMCFICPYREQCALFPHDSDDDTKAFVRAQWQP